MVREGKSLLESAALTEMADRTVFLQARGEDEHSHLRRYALRTSDEACFCERNRETGALEFTSCVSRSLRGKSRGAR